MDLTKKYKYQFYQQQNIQLRKSIRQIDLKIANNIKNHKNNNHSCIFLVLGPSKSGKTSLLRTFQLAVNGTEGWGFSNRNNQITVVDIKKSPKWQVEGVKQVKEIDKKYQIKGWQLNSKDHANIRYKNALQYVQKGLGFCFPQSIPLLSSSSAKVCLICLDISQDLSNQQFTYLRFLTLDLKQRHLKIIYLLTKSDILSFISQQQRSVWLQGRINQLIKDFQIKDRQDILLFQNYRFRDEREENKIKLAYSNSKVEVNQQINYYSLQLIIRLINECQRYDSIREKEKSFLLCGCT